VIDTHCHLLPGLDDGPRTLDDAEALARELVAQGVRTVLCTPHYSRRYPTDRLAAERAASLLRTRLHERGIALELRVAAELSDAMAVSAPLAEVQTRSIERRHVIVEVTSSTPAAFLNTVVSHLRRIDLAPVLAHPERSTIVQRDPSVLDAPRAAGALVQVVAPSVVGRWGAEIEASVWQLLSSGRADLLGSDAHGTVRRRPHLARAGELVAQRLGHDLRDRLLLYGPRELIGGGLEGLAWS
jgi:protein-tyrosine phosphatase